MVARNEETYSAVASRLPSLLNQRVSQEEATHCSTHPLPVVIEPSSIWGLGFIGRLAQTKQVNRWLLIAIDHATDWPGVKAVPDATEEIIAQFLYHDIVVHYGCPREIATDHGSNFFATAIKRYLNFFRSIT
jgi:hypothetical protein